MSAAQSTIVDIYCRSAIQNDEALGAQEAACREYCQANNLTIGEVHVEVFSGAQYRDRPELKSIRIRYWEGKTQGVVITTLDRCHALNFT